MKIMSPEIYVLSDISSDILTRIEYYGRVCYKSEDKITSDSAERFVEHLLSSGHESVLEHVSITVQIICDRGVSHELVRHRLASYSQESTRYCNYSKEKFGGELTFIKPCFFESDSTAYKNWYVTMVLLEQAYLQLLRNGAKPEEARTVLPNSLKTEVIMTANLREWRHILKLRTAAKAHPQMRQVMAMVLKEFKAQVPVIFDDIPAAE
jgi:thymidylate synthase (FAD)